MDNLHKGMKLTLEEAVETLTNIAEMDVDRDAAVALSNGELLMIEETLSQQIMQLIRDEKFDACLELIQETLRVVFHYLQNYDQEGRLSDPNAVEKINAIMVMVGEAAKKLDKYALIIHHEKELCVTKLKEYKKLHDFYRNRITRKIDEGLLSKWIMGLSTRVFELAISPNVALVKTDKMPSDHIFVDLDAVKNDSEYELFFIRKEDGTRFFSPKLLRNIKLICDFGKYITEPRLEDPLASLPIWKDLVFQEDAKEILEVATPALEAFSLHNKNHEDGELHLYLNKAIMALILCSKPHNVWHDPAVKSCKDYFNDFLYFLREALHTRAYNDFFAYPNRISKFGRLTQNLVQSLCKGIFLHLQGQKKFSLPVLNMLKELSPSKEKHLKKALISQQLLEEYHILSKAIKPHIAGPIINLLEQLETGKTLLFDPIFQNNIPNLSFTLNDQWGVIKNIHMASPTKQESIHKTFIIDEFKEYLHTLQHNDHHLLINFQDRNSWRESARANALEELQFHRDFVDHLTVVTLPKDSEFYYQLSPYNHENRADHFMKQLYEQTQTSLGGFYFPKNIYEELSKEQIKGILRNIHTLFFNKKNVLTLEKRQNFIEIFYLMLQLKVIDLVQPTALNFICKDGVDISAAANAQLYLFLEFLNGHSSSEAIVEKLHQIIHVPALFVRERVMLPERFYRLSSAIKELENIREELGQENFSTRIKECFAPYYSPGFLSKIKVIT